MDCLIYVAQIALSVQSLSVVALSVVWFNIFLWMNKAEKPGKYPLRKRVRTPEELKEKLNMKIRKSLMDICTDLKSFEGLKRIEIEVITEMNSEINSTTYPPLKINSCCQQSIKDWGVGLGKRMVKNKEKSKKYNFSSCTTIPSLKRIDVDKEIKNLKTKTKRRKKKKKVSFI